VRLRVATFPDIGSADLATLAVDTDDRVREAATRQLDAMDDALRPDRSI
jgi:hypothetical protein